MIFDRKTQWPLDGPDGDDEVERDNYTSTVGYEAKIEGLFREEAALGWMIEYSDAEAMEKFGETLRIGSLGAAEEKDKVRVVHDGNHGIHANSRIRIKDKVRLPGAGELRERRVRGQKGIAAIGDARKAHWWIKIKQKDWGFMACRLAPGRARVNAVGTCGFSSASYYRSRLAAAVAARLVCIT